MLAWARAGRLPNECKFVFPTATVQGRALSHNFARKSKQVGGRLQAQRDFQNTTDPSASHNKSLNTPRACRHPSTTNKRSCRIESNKRRQNVRHAVDVLRGLLFYEAFRTHVNYGMYSSCYVCTSENRCVLRMLRPTLYYEVLRCTTSYYLVLRGTALHYKGLCRTTL